MEAQITLERVLLRSRVITNSTTEPKESKMQIFMESLLEENEGESDADVSDVETYYPVTSKNMRPMVEKVSVKMTTSSRKKNDSASLDGCSPINSQKTLPKVPSPKPVATSKQESEKLLQLLSNRYTSPLFSTEDNHESTSEVLSASMRKGSEQFLRFLSRHSAPLLASPQFGGTSTTDCDNELELRKSNRNRSSTLSSQTNTSINDHVSPSSEVLQSEFLNEPRNNLEEHKAAINLKDEIEEQELLLEFLSHLQKKKQVVADKLHDTICFLSTDIEEVLNQQSILLYKGNSFSELDDAENFRVQNSNQTLLSPAVEEDSSYVRWLQKTF